MHLPGFVAEVSLFPTDHTYRGVALPAIGGGIRQQQMALPLPRGLSCGPCYYDDSGACVQDCFICPSGQLPDGCDDFTRPCRPPMHCPGCGPCNCTTTCTKNCDGTQVPC